MPFLLISPKIVPKIQLIKKGGCFEYHAVIADKIKYRYVHRASICPALGMDRRSFFMPKPMGKYKRLEVFYLSKPVYTADKPSDCHYCYFWTNGRKGCRLGRNNCYYLISLPPKPKSECDGCPYGRDHPCIGWCTKKVMREVVKQALIKMGVDNFLLSGGGNVASHGERKIKKEGDFYLNDCQEKFCVGIESPQDGNYSNSESDNEAVLVVQGESIVTSGDYQRFYKDVNGVRYHHLIDPDTLYPAVHFRSVSIITADSGLADFLSSAVFLMSYDEGLKLIDSLDGVEAIWLLDDGKIKMSSGLKDNDHLYVIEKDRLK